MCRGGVIKVVNALTMCISTAQYSLRSIPGEENKCIATAVFSRICSFIFHDSVGNDVKLYA